MGNPTGNLAPAFHRAVAAYNAGKLAETEQLCQQIIAASQDFFDALHLLAVVQSSLGKKDAALTSFDRALAVRPAYAEALFNRANTLKELRRLDEALAGYDRALAARPAYAEALYNRGNALYELKRLEEALASYDHALTVRADFAAALCSRGAVLHALGRFTEALRSYNGALVVRADYAEAHANRGVTLHRLGRFAEALASFDRALVLRPGYAETLSNRALTLVELGRFEEALASCDDALTLCPNHAEALCNRGVTLHELERFEAALASYDRALAVRPAYVEALTNRGNAFADLGRLDDAVASFDKALALEPDYAAAHVSASLCLLLQGNFSRGWREFEWRWKTEEMQFADRGFERPLWSGERDLNGRTILLHGEMGFGDTIQFCRYAKLVAQRGAKVVLEAPAELTSLMASLDAPVQVIARGETIPKFDYYCPLASLPLAFGTVLETIPAEVPYLAASREKVALWRDRLGLATRPRIGLVWSGNPRLGVRNSNRIDRQRSLHVDALAPLFQTSCQFYSLQKGAAALAQLRQSAWRNRVVDWTDELRDFADTAALITNLDLVISVDTAVAHLAGAVGKPFWLLNRFNTCWRWLLDREDSPWYPTGRVFRQNLTQAWDEVIARVAEALHDFAHRRA